MLEGLFLTIRKGSGATVICGAKGAEYTMESDSWHNGLFTHVLLEDLSQTEKDSVFLSEIRDYVQAEVNRISNGKLIPSSREEDNSIQYIGK